MTAYFHTTSATLRWSQRISKSKRGKDLEADQSEPVQPLVSAEVTPVDYEASLQVGSGRQMGPIRVMSDW